MNSTQPPHLSTFSGSAGISSRSMEVPDPACLLIKRLYLVSFRLLLTPSQPPPSYKVELLPFSDLLSITWQLAIDDTITGKSANSKLWTAGIKHTPLTPRYSPHRKKMIRRRLRLILRTWTICSCRHRHHQVRLTG